jgi:TM2 domain-containing membrane protein YozV
MTGETRAASRHGERNGVGEGEVAAALSLIPGLGQVYNGHFFRGLGFFAGVTLLMGSVVFVPAGLGLWAYGAYHAWRTARQTGTDARFVRVRA